MVLKINISFRNWMLLLVLCVTTQSVKATPKDSIFTSTHEEAVHYIDAFSKLSPSTAWPSIKPNLFLENLKLNVHEPLSFYPGRSTNFCSYGAVSYLMIKQDPLGYAKFMMELYRDGRASFHHVQFDPTPEVKAAAGTLRFKGVLDVRHAEQMWFMVLADHYKGYLNIFNRRYSTGDENGFWAATNYAKFNKMVKRLLGYHVHAVGSDLMRPWLKDTYDFIEKRMSQGIVVLYLNNRIIHKKNHTKVKLSFPTHFVILEKIERTNDLITLTYWDYGSKTLLQVTPSVLRRLIYGVSICTIKETT